MINAVRSRLGPVPPGETWVGDDAAIVRVASGEMLFATDIVAEGVHVDLSLVGVDDMGWKAMSANVSDMAAMGAVPSRAVVAIAATFDTDLRLLYEGLFTASEELGCPIVGGDLSSSSTTVITIAMLGTMEAGCKPVRRSGAHAGDVLFATGPFGASAAGLSVLRGGLADLPASTREMLARAYMRPAPRVAHGRAAARVGASAMVDVSDGLCVDLSHLAEASGVGFSLDHVPVAEGCTLAEALGGGEDYELVFAAPDPTAVQESFAARGLAPPIRIGVCVEDPSARLLDGEPIPLLGWEHRWAPSPRASSPTHTAATPPPSPSPSPPSPPASSPPSPPSPPPAPASAASWEADPVRLKALLDAVLVIEAYLDLPMVLQRIVDSATSLAAARYGALGVLDADRRRLSSFYTSGISEEDAHKIGDLPTGKGILGLLITDPRPVRIADLSSDPRRSGYPPNHPAMRSFLGVPVRVRGEVFGNLYLADKIGQAEFTEADEEMIVALAKAAGIAIDNARLHAHLRQLSLAQDRERIARDLHDTVVQRLFATGLSLQSVLRRAPSIEIARRLEAAVDDLDETISQIRSTIFALSRDQVGKGELRAEIMTLVLGSAPSLGFEPRVHVAEGIDAVTDPSVCEHLIAALREALSNVGKHARASSVEVTLEVSHRGAGGVDDTRPGGTSEIVLRVVDDGVGIGASIPREGGQGVANLARRAELLGGRMSLSDLGDQGITGTELVWSAPLSPVGS